MKRRDFLAHGATLGVGLTMLSACGGGGGSRSGTPGSPAHPGMPDTPQPEAPEYHGPNPFLHGIASGDPLPTQVILWTRITAVGLSDNIPVGLVVARDPALTDVVYESWTYARADNDFTVKMDPRLPDAGSTYYYQFDSLGYVSDIGRTRTAPQPEDPVAHLRFAVASCSNLPYGYFNAYRCMARRADLEAVIHLGDYIYEYGQGDYNDPELADQRPVSPPHEIVTLEDYRERYRCYRRDPDLQECHRQLPFICVWDDHEIADNTWTDGANNHQPDTEGDFAERKRAAVRAYHEWMPIRPVVPDDQVRIYRSFQYGDLMTLMMLDTRLVGRDEQSSDPGVMRDRNRQLLGEQQETWLLRQLDASRERGAQWHVIGQQVMLSPLTIGALPDMPNLPLGGGIQLNPDQWDGYQTSRRTLLGHIEAMGLDNTVVLTGDIHSSWAMDVSLDPGNALVYNGFTGQGSLAVEFVTPAVTSPAAPTKGLSDIAHALLRTLNPHMKWVDLFHRGYIVLDLTPEQCKADWYHLETIKVPDDQERFARSYFTRSGSNHLERAHTPSAPAMNPAPLAPQLTSSEGVPA